MALELFFQCGREKIFRCKYFFRGLECFADYVRVDRPRDFGEATLPFIIFASLLIGRGGAGDQLLKERICS